MIFLSFCWLSSYSHRFMDLNGKRGPWRYSYPITSFYRWHYLALYICFFHISPWHGKLHDGRELIYFIHCCVPCAPSRFAEQMKKQELGKRKDLPKIVQPVNRKFWLGNFIFWLQIMWLFHDQNSRFLLRIFNYLEALICIKKSESYTVYIYWILFFRHLNYLHWEPYSTTHWLTVSSYFL